ncbi:hypothetical protein [Spartinivicinus ruber]|uniref:hypothetical protein n=1 Tax=Spartinivicinus ruber TaxID=2683272 RepID=UPI0013D27635|nr:hypothetical protein [Spartinivicinus ruber]
MQVNSAFSSGLAGIQRGMQGVQASAETIAEANARDSFSMNKITEAIVDLKVNKHTVEASAKVIKAADENMGTLIDTLA